MQKSALGTFRTMSAHFSQPDATDRSAPEVNPFFRAAMATPTERSAPTAPNTPDGSAAPDADEAALAKAAMWPWEMMNDLNAKMQAQIAEAAQQSTAAKPSPKSTSKSNATRAKTPATKKPASKATASTRAKNPR
jgi:hypothetical protein